MSSSLQTQPKTVEQREQAQVAKGRLPAWVTRSAVVALAIFLTLNAFLIGRFGDEKPSTDLWNGTGSIDIAARVYEKLQQRPQVVLLGSSLMMYPWWAIDKMNYPLQTTDIFHHRHSLVLEDILAVNGQKRPVVYSFAIFGQMISDAYLYVDQFLKGDKTPKYVVFGIAPRDFHDYDLPSPTSSYSFKRLVDLSNFGRYANLYFPSLQDKADYVMQKVCFFFGRRWRLQHEFARAVGKVYDACGIKGEPVVKRPADAAGFMLYGREDVRWNSSKNEYKRRYQNIEGKDIALQMNFLQKLLDLCKERGIKLILVNMPLSDVNRNLMPPGFYDNYRGQLSTITKQSGVEFLDLGASPEFGHNDFWDTSHLNHSGGCKLLQHVKSLVSDTK